MVGGPLCDHVLHQPMDGTGRTGAYVRQSHRLAPRLGLLWFQGSFPRPRSASSGGFGCPGPRCVVNGVRYVRLVGYQP